MQLQHANVGLFKRWLKELRVCAKNVVDQHHRHTRIQHGQLKGYDTILPWLTDLINNHAADFEVANWLANDVHFLENAYRLLCANQSQIIGHYVLVDQPCINFIKFLFIAFSVNELEDPISANTHLKIVRR